MNIMFVIDGILVTPSLSDSILDGVTRDSLLTIARDMNIETEERPLSIADLQLAFETKKITEAFGAGTAAIVSPISIIGIEGKDHLLPSYNENSVMNRIKKRLDDLRYGNEQDVYEWNYIIQQNKK